MNKLIIYLSLLVIAALPAKCKRQIEKEITDFAVEKIVDTLNKDKDNELSEGESGTIYGRIVKISDGDSYNLLTDNKTTIRVRMEGIDAPETGQPHSRKATDYLKGLTRGQRIRLEVTGIDMYGRTLGWSYLEDGRELGKEMIRAGYAWHYKHYNSDKELAELENEARAAGLGLWKDKNPMAPWDYRRQKRQRN